MAGLVVNPDLQGERPATVHLKHILSWHFTFGQQRKSRQASRLHADIIRGCKRKSCECSPNPLRVVAFGSKFCYFSKVYFNKKVANIWGLGCIGARVFEFCKNRVEIENE
jgi:hypothetical protein